MNLLKSDRRQRNNGHIERIEEIPLLYDHIPCSPERYDKRYDADSKDKSSFKLFHRGLIPVDHTASF